MKWVFLVGFSSLPLLSFWSEQADGTMKSAIFASVVILLGGGFLMYNYERE